MYAEVAWVLVSSGTQVQLQVILDPDYLPDYLSVSYDYASIMIYYVLIQQNTVTFSYSIRNYNAMTSEI